MANLTLHSYNIHKNSLSNSTVLSYTHIPMHTPHTHSLVAFSLIRLYKYNILSTRPLKNSIIIDLDVLYQPIHHFLMVIEEVVTI